MDVKRAFLFILSDAMSASRFCLEHDLVPICGSFNDCVATSPRNEGLAAFGTVRPLDEGFDRLLVLQVSLIQSSAAILGHPDCQLEWVRPGIMLYGSSPFEDLSAEELNLKPVMSLQSKIISIKQCSKGDAIGYGGTWICPEDMPVAVIACGYGDGYPRHAPAGTPVMVAGQKTQLIGRVSMDMITVDLRGIDNAAVGSTAELWGVEISVDEVAKLSGTIAYELLCGITARVKRLEVANG